MPGSSLRDPGETKKTISMVRKRFRRREHLSSIVSPKWTMHCPRIVPNGHDARHKISLQILSQRRG